MSNSWWQYLYVLSPVIKARLINITVLEQSVSNYTLIYLTFAEVASVHRGEQFNSWTGPKNLVLSITVPNHKSIQCKKSYLNRFCKVIVFFDDTLKGGNIKINKNSKFLMTNYSRKRERLITKKLSYEFCKKNFNVQ